MSFFDPVWAQDGETYVPTEAEIRAGFSCGPVSPYLFNYLFQNLEATINSLNLEAMVPLTRLVETGTGLQGGGDLSQDRTISIDIASLQTTTVIANNDWVMIQLDGGGYRKITRQNFVAGLGGGSKGDGWGIIGAENVGDGGGQIFAGIDGGETIWFRTIEAGDGLQVSTGSTEVLISFATISNELTID